MKAGPLSASRTAAVATAAIFSAPAPWAMALKSAMASNARAIASSPSRCVSSSSRTRRNEARLPASRWRWPPAW